MEDRFTHGELSEAGKIEIADTTRYFTSNGHVVYGGGGITPDLFVPLDTFELREDYLRWRQYAAGFVFSMTEQNPGLDKQYSLAKFAQSYQISPATYQAYLDYAKTQGEETAVPTHPRVQSELKRFLKARLARQLYGDEGFFKVWNEKDEMITEALRVLRASNPLAAARKE